MRTRVDDMPVYESMSTMVDAAHYNRIHIALGRIGSPLRYNLPRLRGLEIVLDQRLWVVVDGTRQDLPVLAWSDFEAAAREGIDRPVSCRLRLYHAQGGIITTSALDQLSEALERDLQERGSNGGHGTVAAF
ncbi:MAG: hypothetical protein P8X48_04140 [Acidiferrobacteraceae bacterium]